VGGGGSRPITELRGSELLAVRCSLCDVISYRLPVRRAWSHLLVARPGFSSAPALQLPHCRVQLRAAHAATIIDLAAQGWPVRNARASSKTKTLCPGPGVQDTRTSGLHR